MKRLALFLLSAFIASASLFAQAIQYEVKVKYKNTPSGTTADITVTVKKGDPGFTYYLMTNDPIKGAIIMQSEPASGKSYVFKGVKPGKYLLRIEDKMGLPAGRTIEVRENENGKN